jgi:N-acyl-D-amino-acid deacylase
MTSNSVDLIVRGGTLVNGLGEQPFEADVAIAGGKIVDVGRVRGGAREEIDATGKLVTPGFVDIHTHYDGQVMWENRLLPSSDHGVTTVVMGNCGVGFAPCRKEDRKGLVKLMEGVEDIPDIVMAEGLPWNWESFPEYLAAIGAKAFDMDVAAQLPHAPLRLFVMGDRALAGELATDADMRQMAALAGEAVESGALGFSTSRSIFHRDSNGRPICTQDVGEAELQAIANALASAGRGVIEALVDSDKFAAELPILRRIVERSGRPLSFSLVDVLHAPQAWQRGLAFLQECQASSLPIRAQVIGRPTGLLLGLDLSYHPFSFHPTYQAIAHLPLAQRVAQLRTPEVRRRLLSETASSPTYANLQLYLLKYDWMFPLGDPPNYRPPLASSIGAQARRRGCTPEEVALEALLENDGGAVLFVTAANFSDGTLENALEMARNTGTLLGLGDGGAHYGLICDASAPTFMLTYWTRDCRGARLTVPEVVKALSHDNAMAVGLQDRGVLAPGYKADINVIDYDSLTLHAPRMQSDLPGGGRRLRQLASGYVATVVSGQITYRNGVATRQLPGRLVRGPQAAPA